MSSLAQRSYRQELLDAAGIPFADIRQNMQELDFINTWLGGHAITLRGLKLLWPAGATRLHVAEIGCGGGDNLRVLQRWAHRRGYQLQATGVDINPECIRFAQSQPGNKGIEFICSDYRLAQFDRKPDLIFSSLFCHHFTNNALVDMLQWMQAGSRLGFFINDLHRHPLAYQSIKWLTGAFSKSYLVKHDAPLSVARSFVRADWQELFQAAGIQSYQCRWQWAFRWLITYRHAA